MEECLEGGGVLAGRGVPPTAGAPSTFIACCDETVPANFLLLSFVRKRQPRLSHFTLPLSSLRAPLTSGNTSVPALQGAFNF